jgi:hypothetical protein
MTTDPTGHYALIVVPGTWTLAGFALVGGNPNQRVNSASQTVPLNPGLTPTRNFTVVSPYGSVKGTVTPAGLFPSGTTYGVTACPSSQPFSPTCAGGTTTMSTDPTGEYALIVLPGTWTLAGFALVGGNPNQRVDGGPQTVLVSAGLSPTRNFKVSSPYGGVTGTVTPAGPFQPGTTYGVTACPGGVFDPTCPGGVTSMTTDPAGDYALIVPPGLWTLAGFALVGGNPGQRVNSAPTPPVTLNGGPSVTKNFTVPSPTYIYNAGPTVGHIGVPVSVSAVLMDLSGNPVSGVKVSFAFGGAQCAANTNANGRATCNLTLSGPAGTNLLFETFAGDAKHTGSSAATPFTVS